MQPKNSSFSTNKLRTVLKSLPIVKLKQPEEPQNDLTAEIKKVKEQIRNVQNRFNLYTDFDMTDACIYELGALEARYRYLIKRARQEQPDQTPLYSVRND